MTEESRISPRIERQLEQLLEEPYWVVDLLPEQVPADSAGRFFAIEEHFLESGNHIALRKRFASILLKLNCYYDLLVVRIGGCGSDAAVLDPAPTQLIEWIVRDAAHVDAIVCDGGSGELGDALIEERGDDLCMTVYNPSEQLLERIRALAQAEGLFVWQPPAA